MSIGSIGTPFLVGLISGSRPQIQITPLVNIPAGAAIIIGADATVSPGYPQSVTDTAGNSYSRIAQNGNGDPYVSMWAAYNVSPLTPSSTITITYPGSGTQSATAIALAVAGLAQNALDQTDDEHSTSKTMVLDTGQLGLNNELAVAFWTATQAAGAPLIASNWNSVASFQGQNNTHWVNMAWQLEATASPVVVSASIPSPGNGWGGVLATFFPVIIPTGSFHCGGSLTPYHAQTVSATATLGGGGSLTGPSELAAVPPPNHPVFPAGYGPLPADFEEWAEDAFAYVSAGTVFRAEARTTQPVPATAFTPLAFDTLLEDPWKGWSAVSTASQPANSWLAPWTGLYRITFRWLVAAGTSDQWNSAAVGVSGAAPAFEAGGPRGVTGAAGCGSDCSVVVPLIGGSDYVQLLAWSGSSTSTDVSAPGRYPSAEITAVQTDLPG